ncbi:MAG: hypothetical protein WBV06_08305 [Acidimicrobiia bacterium]|jgi:hypothetical protein
MPFTEHKIATGLGAVGIVVLLGHVVLGPDVVPPLVGLAGAALALAAGIVFLLARRSSAGDE